MKISFSAFILFVSLALAVLFVRPVPPLFRLFINQIINESNALQAARALEKPALTLSVNGEDEDRAFFEQHEDLLAAAWKEYGRLHPSLYVFDETFESRYINPELIAALNVHSSADALNNLFPQVMAAYPVYGQPNAIFTDVFHHDLHEEIEHLKASGIPLQRPNGMNKFGLPLSSVGLDDMLWQVTNKYLIPVALHLYPQHVRHDDVSEMYSFIVSYQQGEDLKLAEHLDASAITFNFCLGDAFTGGELIFDGIEQVNQYAGTTFIHPGQLRHSAEQLKSGTRLNLIVWMYGEGGYVRVSPYNDEEESKQSANDKTRDQIPLTPMLVDARPPVQFS